MKMNSCCVCGGREFGFVEVLWPELISDWKLSQMEVDYVNRQQGFYCVTCRNNLRAMALADTILSAYDFSGTLVQFVESRSARKLRVLEINEAGGLTPILKKLPKHQLVRYPEYDMSNLTFGSGSFDLGVHSDTLEHVPNPVSGLAECCRVLTKAGRCIFTVPVIVGRLTRSRVGLKNSYHGTADREKNDYVVQTEFGADMWKYAIEAGFDNARIHSFEYPAALAIEASNINNR
jgi:SAM-dependent methyltransferase